MAQLNSGERLSFIRPASVPGTELLIANNSSRMWRVFHETYTLCSCAQGAASWRYDGKQFSLGDRGNMLMEPGETHCNTVVYKPADFKVLLISPAVVTDAAKELRIPTTPHLRCASNDDPKLFFTLYRFCAAVESRESLLEQQSLFTACVRILLEHTEQRSPTLSDMNEHHAVTRIKRYLQERFAEPICLDELVALTGLSRFHLAHTFSKQVGMPPHIYQINIRIARASALLKAGVTPMKISTDLGFADQSHFTRHFKRIWGTTPGRYINSKRL
jgi:AraC-like DNA-binding protein